MNNTDNIFFELLRVGLFGHTNITESTGKILWDGVDWCEMYRLAEEQSALGLISVH